MTYAAAIEPNFLLKSAPFYLFGLDVEPVYMYINSSGTTNAQGQSVGFETEAFAVADCMK